MLLVLDRMTEVYSILYVLYAVENTEVNCMKTDQVFMTNNYKLTDQHQKQSCLAVEQSSPLDFYVFFLLYQVLQFNRLLEN